MDLFNFRKHRDGWIADAPAKLNLFLEITGKRSDGFHEILTLVLKTDLCDELEFLPVPKTGNRKFELSCLSYDTGEPLPDLPNDSRNLVYRAADLLLSRTKDRINDLSPVKIVLKKKIPAEAGLGGGSGDAAAALYALNYIWNVRLEKQDLEKLGAELGSDVPLFFEKGLILGRGRGEKCQSIGKAPDMDIVLLKPPFGLSAGEVYRQLHFSSDDVQRNFQNISNNVADSVTAENILAAAGECPQGVSIDSGINEKKSTLDFDKKEFCSYDFEVKNERSGFSLSSDCWFNRLEKPAFELRPELREIKDLMESLPDVVKVQLTGSGTVLFAVCGNRSAAERCFDLLKLKKRGQVYLVRSID